MAKKNNIGFLGLSNTTLLLIGGGVALYYLTRPKTENRTIGSIEGVVSKKKKYDLDAIIKNLEKIDSKLDIYLDYTRKDMSKYGEWYYNQFRGEREFMYNTEYEILNDKLWKPKKYISESIEKLKDIQDFVLENDL